MLRWISPAINNRQNNEITNTVGAFTRTCTFSAEEVLYVAFEILKHKLHKLYITQLYKLKATVFIRRRINR